ncbi:MAG: multicopper oxidase domain-containing protein, partial [Candidatus Sulfotelmatobacter sp.]
MGLNRRDLLRMGLCAGAGLLAAPRRPWAQQAGISSAMKMGQSAAHAAPMPQFHEAQPAGPLPSYVTPLSIPPVIRPQSGAIPIQIVPFLHKAHRDLPPATIWGYNGMWPGPTFEVRKGQPLSVKWSNQLPTKHFLPVDYTIHGSEENVPEVRTVTHVHGAQTLPESDGYPDSWFTSDGKIGSVPAANPTHYPNEQSATTLWY